MSDYVSNSATPHINMVHHIAPNTDVHVSPQFNCFLSHLHHNRDPLTFKEGVKSTHWITAMNKELAALEENQTWELTTLPQGKKAIGTKWLFKTKYQPDGSIEHYKARLLVLGNKQTTGIDYAESLKPLLLLRNSPHLELS